MVYVVRADSWWYRPPTLELARKQYNYIMENINGKYRHIEKVYLAEYDGNKTPKILELWKRPPELEEEQGYGK